MRFAAPRAGYGNRLWNERSSKQVLARVMEMFESGKSPGGGGMIGTIGEEKGVMRSADGGYIP